MADQNNYPGGTPQHRTTAVEYQYNHPSGYQRQATTNTKPSVDGDHDISIDTEFVKVSIQFKDPYNNIIMTDHPGLANPSSYHSHSSKSPKGSLTNSPSSRKSKMESLQGLRSDLPLPVINDNDVGSVLGEMANSDINLSATDTSQLFFDDSVDLSATDPMDLVEMQNLITITPSPPIDPQALLEKLVQCHNCQPPRRFGSRLDAFGHMQNVHGLKYCPVCFQLVNCHDSFMQAHLQTNHFCNAQGDVGCPICFETVNHILCFDHISKQHLRPLEIVVPKPENPFQPQPGHAFGFPLPFIPPPPHFMPPGNGMVKIDDSDVKEGLTKTSSRSNAPGRKRVRTGKSKRKPKSELVRRFLDASVVEVLQNSFMDNQYPSSEEKGRLAQETGLSYVQVKNFFQNRRGGMSGVRTAEFTEKQKELLLAAFKRNRYPDCNEKKILGAETGLEYREVTGWFCYARTKWRDQLPKAKMQSNSSDSSLSGNSFAELSDRQLKSISSLQSAQASSARKRRANRIFNPSKRQKLNGIEDDCEQKDTIIVCNKITDQTISEHSLKTESPSLDTQNETESVPAATVIQDEPHVSLPPTTSSWTNSNTKVVTNKKMEDEFKKSNRKLPAEAKEVLLEFWKQKQYPTPTEMKLLMEPSGLIYSQIKDFFHYQRKKLTKRTNLSGALDSDNRRLPLEESMKAENVDSEENGVGKVEEKYNPLNDEGVVATLIHMFNSNTRPSAEETDQIAALTELSHSDVLAWFAERFSRLKRGKLPGYDFKNGLAIKLETTYMPRATSEDCKIASCDQAGVADDSSSIFQTPAPDKETTSTTKNEELVEVSPTKFERIFFSIPDNASFDSTLFTRIPFVRMEKLPDSVFTSPSECMREILNKSSPAGKSQESDEWVTHGRLAPEDKPSLNQNKAALSPRKWRRKGKGIRGPGQKKRKLITEEQKRVLMKSFANNPRPGEAECRRLSRITNRTLLQTIAWFNYKRYELRGLKTKIEIEDKALEITDQDNPSSQEEEEDEERLQLSLTTDEKIDELGNNITEQMLTSPEKNAVEVDLPDNEAEYNQSIQKSESDAAETKESVPDVVTRFREIRETGESEFEQKASSCVLNFEKLLEIYMICDSDDQEMIENETHRVQELIDLYQLHFTAEQEDILMELRIESMNGLLSLENKSTDPNWGNVVAKFHVEDLFRTWHHMAVYAAIRGIALQNALDELCKELDVHQDIYFVTPNWFVPSLLT